MKDDLLIGDTPKALKRKRRLETLQTHGRLWKHSTLRDVDGLLQPDDLDRMFVFTLVRNPWDRVVSYYHWLGMQAFDHPSVTMAQTRSFEDFLRHPDIQSSLHQSPARFYMTDIRGEERCNCYIRLEAFQSDCRALKEHLGFGLEMPHENASVRVKNYQQYYTPELQGIVSRVCAEDIDRFEYRFDP